MTIIDFALYGFDDHVYVPDQELSRAWDRAQSMQNRLTTVALRDTMLQWETGLQYRALQEPGVTDQWFRRALICMAVRGLLGDRAPNFYHNSW